MLLIGLTGGIASGKTLVSDAFAKLGAAIVDADVVAREVVAVGSAGLTALQQEFGNGILLSNGELDRPALREIIFQDKHARSKVEALLHPLIQQQSQQHIESSRDKQYDYLIHAIPLLVETGQVGKHDRIAVVDVPKSVQLDRLMARDDCSAEDAKKILAAQASRDERLAVADDIIDNSLTIEHTLEQVQALHDLYGSLNAASA